MLVPLGLSTPIAPTPSHLLCLLTLGDGWAPCLLDDILLLFIVVVARRVPFLSLSCSSQAQLRSLPICFLSLFTRYKCAVRSEISTGLCAIERICLAVHRSHWDSLNSVLETSPEEFSSPEHSSFIAPLGAWPDPAISRSKHIHENPYSDRERERERQRPADNRSFSCRGQTCASTSRGAAQQIPSPPRLVRFEPGAGRIWRGDNIPCRSSDRTRKEDRTMPVSNVCRLGCCRAGSAERGLGHEP